MTTITLTLIDDGKGSSPEIAITGDVERNVVVSYAEMSEPVTEEQIAAFISVMIRLARRGRTPAQTRALLAAGVTVTV